MSACIMAVHALVFYTFGIFLVPLTAEFNWDRGALSVFFQWPSYCLDFSLFLAED